MSEGPYVVLCDGNAAWAGDNVRCVVAHYSSLQKGAVRPILRIEDGNIILNNTGSPYGTSPYRPSNFALSSRAAKQENTTMLHIAVEWRAGTTLEEMASFLQHASSPPAILVGTTKEEIQAKIRNRLSLWPGEKWLILSANTIGERSDPPVRFRSI